MDGAVTNIHVRRTRFTLTPGEYQAIFWTAILAAIAITWNLFLGLSFQANIWAILIIPATLFSIAGYYLAFRPARRHIIEVTLYAGLWTLFPWFAVYLTYEAATLNFPLQDKLLASLDAAMGFHWKAWFDFCQLHPWFARVQSYVYWSFYLQPFLLIPLLAGSKRNAQFLLATFAAFAISTLGSAIFPAFGPPAGAHVASVWEPVTAALRAGGHGPFPYTGMISFPSFHAAMGVLYILMSRGNRLRFLIFLALNIALFFSVPYVGGHYLTDVIAGIAVAIIAHATATKLAAG